MGYGDDAKEMMEASKKETPRGILQMKALLEFSKIEIKYFSKVHLAVLKFGLSF